MITQTKAYQTKDGSTFGTLDEAKEHELRLILPASVTATDIVKNSDMIVDILTTGPGSRPKARKVNGGRKPRKVKGAVTPEEDSSSHRGRAGTSDQPSV